MNNKQGFIPIALLIAILIVVAVGGVYYFVKQQWPVLPTPSTQSTPIPSDSKIYSSPEYGFEFKYPTTWGVVEIKDGIKLISPQSETSNITFVISSTKNGVIPINCPMSSHEVECKKSTNSNGVQYARTINTGQLQYNKQKQLNGWLTNSKIQIQISSPLTDISGNALPFSTEAASVFDGILRSIKFATQTNLNTSNATANWKPYRNEKYGFEFKYPAQNFSIKDSINGTALLEYGGGRIPNDCYTASLFVQIIQKNSTEGQNLLQQIKTTSFPQSNIGQKQVYTRNNSGICAAYIVVWVPQDKNMIAEFSIGLSSQREQEGRVIFDRIIDSFNFLK